MSMVEEFKKFVMRGNVVDLAVGVIIGAAFGGIVTSLVKDVLTPPLGYMMGGIDFSEKSIDLPGEMIDPDSKDKPAAEQKKVPVRIKYGIFLQKTIDFLITAFCLFMVIKAMNKLQRKKDQAAPEDPADVKLLTEIRDLLKKQES